MALHIQMSDEAEAQLKKAALRNKLSSIAACIAFLLIGGGILYGTVILISNSQPPAFETYVAPATDKAPSKKPKVKELSSSEPSSSAKIAPSVIVSSEASAVAMASVDIPTTDVGIGQDLGFDMGMGDGIGNGLGGGGGEGMGSSEPGGSALEGTFYDLKLTKSGGQTDIKLNPETNWLEGNGAAITGHTIGQFVTNGWDPKYLAKYYKSPTKLYASYFMLPACNASYGPKAFKADKKVKPSAWVVVYRGKVKAPKTGKFRFVGTADDGITVRFNRKVVLEGGYCIPTAFDANMDPSACGERLRGIGGSPEYLDNPTAFPGHEDYKNYAEPSGWWSGGTRGLNGGNVFSVVEGKEYPIEILVTEIPGGVFGMMLFIEDIGSPRTKDGRPIFDLFRTNFTTPDMAELSKQLQEAGAQHGGSSAPAYNEDSLIWTVVP